MTARLGLVRDERGVGTVTLATCIGGHSLAADSAGVDIFEIGRATGALPKTLEPKVLPATANVDVIGVN